MVPHNNLFERVLKKPLEIMLFMANLRNCLSLHVLVDKWGQLFVRKFKL